MQIEYKEAAPEQHSWVPNCMLAYQSIPESCPCFDVPHSGEYKNAEMLLQEGKLSMCLCERWALRLWLYTLNLYYILKSEAHESCQDHILVSSVRFYSEVTQG